MKARHSFLMLGLMLGLMLAFYSPSVCAALVSERILEGVVVKFVSHALHWRKYMMEKATILFWALGTISLVWTFGLMALRKADIGEFFAEFIRFSLFLGFFLWLLQHGPDYTLDLLLSMREMGERASGLDSATPTGIVDVGFLILQRSLLRLADWSPVESAIGMTLSLGIMMVLTTAAVNMILLVVAAVLLMYAGIFLLGFGGSRWTSDIALNYYKTLFGIGLQIMTIVLLTGISNEVLIELYGAMNPGAVNFEELAVMLVFCSVLMIMVNKLPPLVASILTGAAIGNAGGIGSHGPSEIAGALGSATSAVEKFSSALTRGVAGMAGDASALLGAFSKAGQSMSAGTAAMSSFAGSGSGGNDAGAFSEATGFGPTNAEPGVASSQAGSSKKPDDSSSAAGTEDDGSGGAPASGDSDGEQFSSDEEGNSSASESGSNADDASSDDGDDTGAFSEAGGFGQAHAEPRVASSQDGAGEESDDSSSAAGGEDDSRDGTSASGDSDGGQFFSDEEGSASAPESNSKAADASSNGASGAGAFSEAGVSGQNHVEPGHVSSQSGTRGRDDSSSGAVSQGKSGGQSVAGVSRDSQQSFSDADAKRSASASVGNAAGASSGSGDQSGGSNRANSEGTSQGDVKESVARQEASDVAARTADRGKAEAPSLTDAESSVDSNNEVEVFAKRDHNAPEEKSRPGGDTK